MSPYIGGHSRDPIDPPEPVFQRCRGCGCTEEFSCEPGGCIWVESDLCSKCADEDHPFHAHSIARRRDVGSA